MTDLIMYKGIFVREGYNVDKGMVNDCLNHYTNFTFDSSSIIMDLGANIGGFAHIVKGSEHDKYVAFEPDEDNFQVLKQNAPSDAILIKGAASMNTEASLTFYQTESKNAPCSGTVDPIKPGMRKKRTIVDNYFLPDVLEMYKPTHLKVDIESAESKWLNDTDFSIPDHVQELAIEIHRTSDIQKLNDIWIHQLKEDFDIVEIDPCTGFANDKEVEYPNLGFSHTGTLFGIDMFLRRK